MKDHLTSALAQLNGSADWNERTGGIVSAKLTPFESRDVLFALNELQRRAEIAETNNSNLQMSLRNWIDKCAAQSIRLGELERENATLRKALADADELERYSGSNGERQWGRCSTWLHPDDAVVIISAKALDAAQKEAQP